MRRFTVIDVVGGAVITVLVCLAGWMLGDLIVFMSQKDHPSNKPLGLVPHTTNAMLFCPNMEPMVPEKWDLREGRIIVLTDGVYIVTPSGCALVVAAGDKETKVASK